MNKFIRKVILISFICIFLSSIVNNSVFAIENNINAIERIAHRGYAISYSENTIPAFISATEKGFDSWETDVSFTNDDIPILFHDATLDNKTNGTGLVIETSYEDILNLDLDRIQGNKVSTYEDFLINSKGKTSRIYSELKNLRNVENISKVVSLIETYGWDYNSVVQSFNFDNLVEVRKLNKNVTLGFLCSNIYQYNSALDYIKNDSNSIVLLNYKVVLDNPSIVKDLNDKGIELGVWTCNKAEDYKRLVALGVKKIVSDVYIDDISLSQLIPKPPVLNSIGDNDIYITGKAENGTRTYIEINGKEVGVSEQVTNGSFKVYIPSQKIGITINAYSKDIYGNKSSYVNLKVIDKTPPKLKINQVDDNDKYISGTTEVGSLVTIKIGKKSYSPKVSSSGKFKLAIPIQKPDSSISVYAKDKVGNQSNIQIRVIDKTPPSRPRINYVTTKSTLIKGKAEVGTTVYIKIGSNSYKAISNSKGEYSLKISKQKRGTRINVYAKDKAGNNSSTIGISVR